MVPGGTTRPPACSRFFLVGILSWYSNGPTSRVSISAIVKYRLIAIITHAFERHSPPSLCATRNSPRSRAATASKTAPRCSSPSSRLLSSNAASIFSLTQSPSLLVSLAVAARLASSHRKSAGLRTKGILLHHNQSDENCLPRQRNHGSGGRGELAFHRFCVFAPAL